MYRSISSHRGPNEGCRDNDFLKANTVDESIVDALKLTFDDMYSQMLAMRASEIDRLRRAIDDLGPREARLLDLYVGDKGVSKELFQRQIKALEDERVELQDQRASLRIEDINATEVFVKAKEILCDLYGSWNRLEPIHRLQFLHFLVPQGLVWENGGVGTAFNPSGVRGILDFPTPNFSKALPAGFEPASPP